MGFAWRRKLPEEDLLPAGREMEGDGLRRWIRDRDAGQRRSSLPLGVSKRMLTWLLLSYRGDRTGDAGQRWGKTGLHDLGRWLCCPPLVAHRRDLPSLAGASGGGDGSRILDLESGLHDLGHLPVMVMEPVKGLPWSERLAACGSAMSSDRWLWVAMDAPWGRWSTEFRCSDGASSTVHMQCI
ncbi:hypothetical protein ACLOJK_022151 [Asimina triloba]